MKVYLVFILLISNLINLSIQGASLTSVLFQKICYLRYVPYSLPYTSGHDMHKLTIEWDGDDSTNDLIENIDDMNPETWKSCQFRDGTTNQNGDNYNNYNNDNLAHQYYNNFLIQYNGFLPNYSYVAWDIQASCSSPNNLIRKVEFNIKYFSCVQLATSFYTSLASTSRVLASSSIIVDDDVVSGELRYRKYLIGNINDVPACLP